MKNKLPQYIKIDKASEHNLKNVSIQIPHHKITCFTGVSGSGKSSLVYDIICKESQRRYFESFSSYARQFLGKLSHPEVESIEGLMPAISVDQKTVSRNPRSTVGTMSEIYDYLRLLFARVGTISDDQVIKINRSLFSFNSMEGACPYCKGLGVEDQIDPKLLIKDPNKSLREGALKITTPSGYTIYSQVTIDVLNQVCESEGFNVDIPWKDLTPEQKHIILNGSDKIKIPFGKHTLESRMKWSGITAKPREEGYYKGILPIMENILRVDRNPNILRFAKTVECSQCKGQRLNKQALQVTINEKSIIDYAKLSVTRLKEKLNSLSFDRSHEQIANPIIEKISERCSTIDNLGLGYLDLMRESTTLSGGEAQRIRLATQIGNGLRGMLYILDEPSIGLHPRDNHRMIEIMQQIKSLGNTVLVVEHDKETMLCSDQIVDIGPYAGKNGGEILFNTKTSEIATLDVTNSETLKLLHNQQQVPTSEKEINNKDFTIKGACLHNLKNINATFKLRALNMVTGVSGAGKSTLVFETIGKYFKNKFSDNQQTQNHFDSITSDSEIKKLIEIDQTPIGRTPRSNPATYTKLFDQIRKLFASQPESKARKWNQGHFSFNTKGGRCETCEGAGYLQTGMHFLSHVETVCETCDGKRYDDETLQITYKGKNISEILQMEISEAYHFFKEEPKIFLYLKIMKELGLGYLSLGQSSTTLSGGEAQRLKLAAELVKPAQNHTLYLFDEPTTGLHSYDVKILLSALRNLTQKGHTVIVIEHDVEIIKNSDYIIDLGPEGGEDGGKVIFNGTFNNLLDCNESYTGKAFNVNYNLKDKPDDTILQHNIRKPITLKGVNTNNLKNIDVEIPRNKFTVITGVSGSGKSSLAFDTLFSEGQFRYTESFSTYARSLIQQKSRPEITESDGLTPTIAIDNKSITQNPRATVGTVSGLYDLYRLLFSRISKDQNGNRCEILSNHFSFNHQAGACKACNGLGFQLTCDPDKLITHPELPLSDGAMQGSKPGQFYGDSYGQYMATLQEAGKKFNINFGLPWNQLSDEAKNIALFGTGDTQYNVEWKYKRKNREGTHKFKGTWPGLVYYVNDEYQRKHDKQGGQNVVALMKEVQCESCQGARLSPEILQYTVADKNISQLSDLEANNSILYFEHLKNVLSPNENLIAAEIIRSCLSKLDALVKIGLGYLKPNRNTMSLSGGEGRRLRLVSQLGGELSGITYVLDEPTVGLHSKDTQHLIELIKKLSEKNTVVVVEHDREIIQSADHIIELGPGAGNKGGEIISAANYNDFLNNKKSLTAKYLKNNYKIGSSKTHLDLEFTIEIQSASANNLKNIDLKLPTNGMTVFSGVSGSGKSSLLFDVIAASAAAKKAIRCKQIDGLEHFEEIIKMDQSPIGRNPLSTPLTYLGLYDKIRDLFASTQNAVDHKFKKSHFSYNTKGGRCETCKGQGMIKISMDFLSDVWVKCSDCEGKRFKEEVLKVSWNNLSISEILNLTINSAADVFSKEVKLKESFEQLNDLGLGHLKLGQSATTLSGGEAQRLKLAKELLKNPKNKCLYLLDEPTTGLHFYDIEKLLDVLYKLRDQGHAIYIIEHHPWLVKLADFVVELGPEGGENGGYVMQ